MRKIWLYSIVIVGGGLLLGVYLLARNSGFFHKESPAPEAPVSATVTPPSKFLAEFKAVNMASQEILRLNAQGVSAEVLKPKLTARRAQLIDLMKKDPQAAWAALYPPSVIAQLPVALQDQVEKEVTIKGELQVMLYDDFKNQTSEFSFSVRTPDGAVYDLYIVGEPSTMRSGTTVTVHGYKVDDSLLARARSGTVTVDNTPSPDVAGAQNTLFVLMRFEDSEPNPFTPAQAKDTFLDGPMNAFFKEASYGKTWFTGDVAGWYTLERNVKTGCSPSSNNNYCRFYSWPSAQDAYDFIKNSFDLSKYSRMVLIVNDSDDGMSYSGRFNNTFNDGKTYKLSISWVGVSNEGYSYQNPYYVQSWERVDAILSHELGHALGVYHANAWDCGAGRAVNGACTPIEYGNDFDVMGSATSMHFNAFFKETFGWLDSSSLTTISANGTYTINSLEENSGVRAAKIQLPNGNKPFYIEYRRPIGFDVRFANNPYTSANQGGLLINWVPYPSNLYSRLIDMTPATDVSKWLCDWCHAVLPSHNKQRFVDYDRGVSVGPVTISSDKATATFPVKFFDPICTPRPPQLKSWAYDVAPGRTAYLSFSIKNLNGHGCPPSSFAMSVSMIAPADWTVGIASDNPITLAPESDFSYIDNMLEVPANATIGSSYSINITITDLQSGLKTEGTMQGNVTSSGDNNGVACLAAGTKITMADGSYKNIENVKVGDSVKSRDGSGITSAVVTRVIQREDPIITINGILKAATDQVIYLATGYAISADNLEVGDELLNENGEAVAITSITVSPKLEKTYDFAIDNGNSFYADGYLVKSLDKSIY